MSLHADEWVPLVAGLPPEGRTWTLKPVAADELTITDARSGSIGEQPTQVMDSAGATVPPAPRSLRPGTLSERIEAESGLRPLRHLGSGGMGDVVLMHQARLDRPVAVKMLNETRRGGKWLAQFRAEVHATCALEHPAVVPVHDAGDDYLVMKCVDGQTFEELLDRDPRPPLSELVEILVRVTECIAYAHANGIIHRDLKPANIMVGPFGETYLMDWGLALAISERAPVAVPRVRTTASVCAGTPCYLAPEVARGRRDLIAAAVDAFGIAGLLHRILAGRPPWPGADARASVEAAAREERPPLAQLAPDAPTELVVLCEQGLVGTPSQRLAVDALLAGLRRWLRRSGERAEGERLLAAAMVHLREGERATEAVSAYAELRAAADRAQRAYELAPSLDEAERCAQQARFVLARRALDNGDLVLADTAVQVLTGPSAAKLQAEVRGLIARRARWMERTRWLRRQCRWLVPAVVLVALAFPASRLFEDWRHEAERREQAEALWAAIASEERRDQLDYQRALAQGEQALGLHPEPAALAPALADLAAAATRAAIQSGSPDVARVHLEQAVSHGLAPSAREGLLGRADQPGTIAWLEAETQRQRAAERARRRTRIAGVETRAERGEEIAIDALAEELARWGWAEDDPVTAALTVELVTGLLRSPHPALRRVGLRTVASRDANAAVGVIEERLASALPLDLVLAAVDDPHPQVAAEAIRALIQRREGADGSAALALQALHIADEEVRQGVFHQLSRSAVREFATAIEQWRADGSMRVPTLWVLISLSFEGVTEPDHPLQWHDGHELHLKFLFNESDDERLGAAGELLADHDCLLPHNDIRKDRSHTGTGLLHEAYGERREHGSYAWQLLATQTLIARGMLAEAMVDFPVLIERVMDEPSVFVREAATDRARGQEEFALALVLALDNARRHPARAIFQHQFSRAFFEADFFPEALETSWEVSARWPGLGLANARRAFVLMRWGELEEAERQAALGVSRHHGGYTRYFVLGAHAMSLAQLGREAHALTRYGECLQLHERGNAFLQEALALAHRTQFVGTAYLFDHILLLDDPANTPGHRRHLRAALRAGAIEVALADLQVALREAHDPAAIISDLAVAVPGLRSGLPSAVRNRLLAREALFALASDDRAGARSWLDHLPEERRPVLAEFVAAVLADDRAAARAAWLLAEFDQDALIDAAARRAWSRHLDRAETLLPLPWPFRSIPPPPLAERAFSTEELAVAVALLQSAARPARLVLPEAWLDLPRADAEELERLDRVSPDLRLQFIQDCPMAPLEWQEP